MGPICKQVPKCILPYCSYDHFAGEKRKEEERNEVAGRSGQKDASNSELDGVEEELYTNHKKGTLDAFGLYLYGIVLREKGIETEGRDILVESVNSYPWNWSAWLELQALCTDLGILNRIQLKDHWMKQFFLAKTLVKLERTREGLDIYEKLDEIFPSSDYVYAQAAKAHYNLNHLDAAEGIFKDILKTDPYRIDGMDVYSNVLYRKESSVQLSYLAHRVSVTDKYRPETCIIIGNYYSLKGQHENSVSAYLRPDDARMWVALGNCYEQHDKFNDAIKCYIHALKKGDSEGVALDKLARLHNQLGKFDEAALFYYKTILQKMENEQNEGPEAIEALLYLANYCKNQQNFAEAEVYCTKLLDYGGLAREDARTILRVMKNAPGAAALPMMDLDPFEP
eukprot:Gb_18773 [translate_table: standard]